MGVQTANWAATAPISGLQNGTSRPAIGQALVWNGYNWVPGNVAGEGGVTSIIAGTGIILDPPSGTGDVEIISTGIVGPTGPAGTPGAPGAAGPTGPAGPAGSPGSGTYVDSIAALRSLPAPPADTFAVVGSYAASALVDGGGGTFAFVASDSYSHDNGGTLIVPGGVPPVINPVTGLVTTPGTSATVGCWHRVMYNTRGNGNNSGTLNVQWFGANGTVADVVPYLNLAFAALYQNAGGVTPVPGTLLFPADEYVFGSKWMVDMGNNSRGYQPVSIKGDGDGGTHFLYGLTAYDTAMIEIKGGQSGGTLQDVGIRPYNPPTGGLYYCPSVLYVHGTTYFSLLNVKASQMTAGALFGYPLTAGSFVSGDTYTITSIGTTNFTLIGAGSNTVGLQFTATGVGSGTGTAAFGPGVFNFSNNQYMTVLGCQSLGGSGTQLYWNGGSGLVSNNQFGTAAFGYGSAAWVSGTVYTLGKTVLDVGITYVCRNISFTSSTHPASDATNWQAMYTAAPCFILNTSDTLSLQNNFFQGGGPWMYQAACAVTSNSSTFTVTTPAAHGMKAGDYIIVNGAVSHAGYDAVWKVASITATTLVVTSAANLGTDTVWVSSLWSSMYVQNVTESEMDLCFFNSGTTGSTPGLGADGSTGSIGVFIDGYGQYDSAAGGFPITNCVCDYGATAFFMHGVTNTDPGSTCKGITLVNCRPNGGPRDTFGAFRIEGCNLIVLDSCQAFPGNNNPPGTGLEFDSVVISDGGQTNNTQDITITGGTYTNKNSTGLYGSATIVAFTFDGANVHNVSVVNAGVNASSTVAQFVNRSGTGSAAASNGITVLYGNNAGRITVIDSTGTHNL